MHFLKPLLIWFFSLLRCCAEERCEPPLLIRKHMSKTKLNEKGSVSCTTCGAELKRSSRPAPPENNHKSGCCCPRLLSAGAAETAHSMNAVMDGILCTDGLFQTRRGAGGRRVFMPGKPSLINWTKGPEGGFTHCDLVEMKTLLVSESCSVAYKNAT